MADDEGEEAEVFVLFCVDFGVGHAAIGGRRRRRRRRRGSVVAEHADESWGAFVFGERDAGVYEGGEDVRVQVEGVRDRGGDFRQEGSGQVPGGLELGSEGERAAGGRFDRDDGFLVGDLREAFFAGGGAAAGEVVCLFWRVRG